VSMGALLCLSERGWWWWGVQELDLHDLLSLDPALGQQVEQLDLLIRRQKHRQQAGGATGGADLLLGGASVEELCLDFTLPGYPEYELKEGGAECSVTLANLEEYVTLLLQATLDTGVAPQVDAFRTGFNQVRHPANARISGSTCTLPACHRLLPLILTSAVRADLVCGDCLGSALVP
jgi:hypothetical protein